LDLSTPIRRGQPFSGRARAERLTTTLGSADVGAVYSTDSKHRLLGGCGSR